MAYGFFRRVKENFNPVRKASGPSGKRLFAIGDVHGRLDLLDELLAKIAIDIAERPVASVVLVFLGDLIDRGEDSAGVLERLCRMDEFPARRMILMGNHEEMLVRVLDGEAGTAYDWLDFGGDALVESYGLSATQLRAKSESDIADALAQAMPREHMMLLRNLADTVRFGDYLLVHAGIRPGVPVDQQQLNDLRWIREPFLSDAHDHGCVVIHGHTVTADVDQRSNRIGIDTGAYRSGVLTAAVIEGKDVRFLQTGAAGLAC